MNFFRDLWAIYTLSAFQVIADLQVHPELRGVTKITRQPESRVRCYCAAFAHNVIDTYSRCAAQTLLALALLKNCFQGSREAFRIVFCTSNVKGPAFYPVRRNIRVQ